MRIPAINLRPLLDATRAAWQTNLDEFIARQQFILGPQLAAFEREFGAAMGARFAVGVGTGTAAIELCLREAGVTTPKQEVLTSALTAPFTGTAIVAAGARIRFADVDPETLLMDPADAGNRAGRRTAAIVPVHLYGQPCEMDRIRKVARPADAVIVQDACQAHGARYRGEPLTAYSPYVAYSFYPTKNLGALGDGGAIATSSAAVDRRLRMLRDGGRRDGRQVAEVAGINSRLDEMQTCFLRAFLGRLEEWNADRRRIARLYDERLAGCAGVRPVRTSDESVRHLYVVRARRRDKLRAYLASQGIGSGIHYATPLHLMPAFADCGLKKGDLPHAERACGEIVSLPLWPFLGEAEVDEVCSRVRTFYS